MKKMKALLFTILFGMFLTSCGPTPAAPKKASIKIETNQFMTTSLEEGEYELNKAIEFTVSALNEEYSVTSVKMDDTELPPANAESNKYSFTPTEEKEYKLKVSTEENENIIIFTFDKLTPQKYREELTKKGVRLNIDNQGAGYDELIKNGNLSLQNNLKLAFLYNDSAYGKRVLLNKIVFTFVSGKENLTYTPTAKDSYEDGVWKYSETSYDEDRADLLFLTKGDVVISKIVITTVPYVPFKIKLGFNNLMEGDKVYFLDGPTYQDFQKKQEVTADSEFIAGQAYYLYFIWNQYHKDFFSDLAVKYKGQPARVFKFYPDADSGLPQVEIVTYLLTPVKEESKTNTLDLEWADKAIEEKDLQVDITSANKYVKHFMETDPLTSLGLTNLFYGSTTTISLRAKNGYMNLKVIVNGVAIEKEEDSNDYKFSIPRVKPLTIAFTAEEGDEERQGKDVIELTGKDKDKGVILCAEDNGTMYISLSASEDHPTAYLNTLSFDGTSLTRQVAPKESGEENVYFFTLNSEQAAKYKNTPASERAALFSNATVAELDSYKSTLVFNKGDYKITVNGQELIEENALEINGKSSVTVKVTPNEFKEIHSIEVNDKRLANTNYTLNQEDGSITYTFNANAKKYDFFIQAKPQVVTLALDETSTTGYKIKDLPAQPVTCGQSTLLTLGVTDDAQYWLSGKKITVTYNGKEAQVTEVEGEFKFTIIPVKGVSNIKVIVTDNPQQ